MLAHAQRHAQHHAAGAERVVRDPIDEPAQLRPQRRDIELALDLLEAIVQAGPHLDVVGPHHAGRRPRPQRHRHQVARREIEVVRHPVRIGVIERDRDQHIDDAFGHAADPPRFSVLKEG
jgi:hypothetical protein